MRGVVGWGKGGREGGREGTNTIFIDMLCKLLVLL